MALVAKAVKVDGQWPDKVLTQRVRKPTLCIDLDQICLTDSLVILVTTMSRLVIFVDYG
jgi:hypothetical protein